jgi:transposase
LFFTGRKHAGENLVDVLLKRDVNLPPPIQMSDALSRNLPKGHTVIESNCLSHGRRQIVDEIENYPSECRFLLERLARVYHVDSVCKKLRVTAQTRLLAHQRRSGPIMDELRSWMNAKLDEKLIEPNCNLGQAFTYLLKHWEKFTLFLRALGAPLDNNICERALKMAIKHRKGSLFYRTQRGATVGDIFMSLIHTAELHHENPFDYLTALQRNHKALALCPADWMPWNYRDTLARLQTDGPPVRVSSTSIAA